MCESVADSVTSISEVSFGNYIILLINKKIVNTFHNSEFLKQDKYKQVLNYITLHSFMVLLLFPTI